MVETLRLHLAAPPLLVAVQIEVGVLARVCRVMSPLLVRCWPEQCVHCWVAAQAKALLHGAQKGAPCQTY